MKKQTFNYDISDSQGTYVEPISIKDFDLQAYADYEASMLENNRLFWSEKSGVAVYRRFRAPEVFSYGCKDMKLSLELQLAALNSSMEYKADIANFLEPWYGIGTVPSAFGAEYIWKENQAPATEHLFNSVEQAMNADIIPIHETAIGKKTLKMIEYFLDQTKGLLPISLTDTQSPINIASFLIETNSFYMSFFDDPDHLKELLKRIEDLLVDFTKKQMELIGGALAKPGHGFASSRAFDGLGMSDDVTTTLSPELVSNFHSPSLCRVGSQFKGFAFHSCGDWCSIIETVRNFPELLMVDAAFTSETDPAFNDPEIFKEKFCDTGIIINARMVGDASTVIKTVKSLAKQGDRLITVTYCDTPEEQQSVYEKIHKIFDEDI